MVDSYLPGIPSQIDTRKGVPNNRIKFPENHLSEVLKHKTTTKLSASLGNWVIDIHKLKQGTNLPFIQEFLYIENSAILEIFTLVSIKELLNFKYSFNGNSAEKHYPILLNHWCKFYIYQDE